MPERRATGDGEDVVDGLLQLAYRVQHAVSTVAARHDLTSQQVALLRMLDKPVSMRSFAWDLECDPSNVTGLVDRAERLDLVERVPAPDDRRVRMLTLTAKGRRVRDEVNRDLARQLADDLGLCGADRDGTVALLRGVAGVVDTRMREREQP